MKKFEINFNEEDIAKIKKDIAKIKEDYKSGKCAAMLIDNGIDILIPIKEGETFEERLVESILEGVSKEQKEIAQRVENKETIKLSKQLKNYLDNKWSKLPKTKENRKKAAIEYERLFHIINIMSLYASSSDPEMKHYFENVIGDIPHWLTLKSNNKDSLLRQEQGEYPALIISNKKVEKINPKDFDIQNLNDKKLRILIRKEIIMHEYGHLFEWFKEAIETGFFPENKDTKKLFNNKNFETVQDLEGKANAYAIDNMYRKDRRELLKNSEKYKSIKNEPESLISLAYNYRVGTLKHSKTLEPTLKSIRVEEANKSKELQTIYKFSKKIEDMIRELGYEVPHISYLVSDNFFKNKEGLTPLYSLPNGKKIYIDIDAYKDLANSVRAIWFYLPHEIAHIVSNENHNGRVFNAIINDWNETYPLFKIVAEPDNEDFYNQRFLPNYYKKEKYLSKLGNNDYSKVRAKEGEERTKQIRQIAAMKYKAQKEAIEKELWKK